MKWFLLPFILMDGLVFFTSSTFVKPWVDLSTHLDKQNVAVYHNGVA